MASLMAYDPMLLLYDDDDENNDDNDAIMTGDDDGFSRVNGNTALVANFNYVYMDFQNDTARDIFFILFQIAWLGHDKFTDFQPCTMTVSCKKLQTSGADFPVSLLDSSSNVCCVAPWLRHTDKIVRSSSLKQNITESQIKLPDQQQDCPKCR